MGESFTHHAFNGEFRSMAKYVVLAYYTKDFTYVSPTDNIAKTDPAKEN